MKHLFFICFLFYVANGFAQEVIPAEIQIKTALLAAPEAERSGATVLGYDTNGKLVTLKKGDGKLICLADDTRKDGIQVSCYSANLEPFMARGRELLAERKSEEEKQKIREQDAADGKLKMPEAPNVLYVLSGKEENYNKTTGELKDGYMRYVFYVPYATPESTGLSPKPSGPGVPWLMDPGSYKAHIMISPPRK